jgi:O-antigen/teichoic acid export membrane protein
MRNGYHALINLQKKLVNEGFIKNVLIIAGGTTLGQVITILFSPLLTHLYQPEDFGLLAVYISILGFCSVISSLRYDLAIPLPKDDREAVNLLSLSIVIVCVLTVFLSLGVYLWGSDLARVLGVSTLSKYLWILPLSFLGIGFYQALNGWAIREQDYTAITKTKLNQSLGQLIVQLGAGILSLGKVGLLLGDMAGRVGGSGLFVSLLWKRNKDALRLISWNSMKKAAYEYRKFPLISSGSALLNSLGLQITPLLIALHYGAGIAGLWALSERIIGAPMALVGRAISQVYFGEAALLARKDPEKLKKMFMKTALNLLKFGCIPILLLMVIGPWLFDFVFGSAWHKSGEYLRILAPMYLIQFIAVPLDSTLLILQKQNWQLYWDSGRLVLISAGLMAAGWMGFKPEQAIWIYSVLMGIGYSVMLLLCIKAINQNITSMRKEKGEDFG